MTEILLQADELPGVRRTGTAPVGTTPATRRGRFGSSRIAVAVLVIVIAFGGYLRLAELGRDDFGPDELFHYYAAESLRRGEGQRLPSGDSYTRGSDMNRLIAFSIDRLGATPTAVRLPNALIGSADLLLFAAVLWGLGGPWAAVWGTLLLALCPAAVTQGRETRLYSYQLWFGLLGLYAGWRTLRDAGRAEQPAPARVLRQWLWALATIVAFLLAIRVQVVTLSVALGWGVCVGFAAAADLVARGWKGWRTSVAAQLATLGFAAAVALLLLEPGRVAEMLRLSQQVPAWARAAGSQSPLLYVRSLYEAFPVVVALLPLTFMVVLLRLPRLGVYLLTWFAVPFLLHTLLLPNKAPRFLLLAVPALFAATAIAATRAAAALWEWVHESVVPLHPGSTVRRAVASAATVAAALFLVLTTPALVWGWKDVHSATGKWSRTATVLEARPDLRGVPLGHTAALHALFYLGRDDFVITPDAPRLRGADGAGADPGVPLERKTGVPVLTTPDAIRSRFREAGEVLIGMDSATVEYGRVDPDLYRVLREQGTDLCRTRCGSAMLYLWRFAPPTSGGSR
ncbi:hypothetical protein BH23GEM3_BH23GEM3_17490 [soil metagenome]